VFPLKQALYDHDLIVLRVIGEWWDLDLSDVERSECVEQLTEALSAVELRAQLQELPPEEAAAFQNLINGGGSMPVAKFARQHGEIRLMGRAKLEREEPWLDPSSPAEGLWYRGLIFKAFHDQGDGILEYIYLPEELVDQVPGVTVATGAETGSLPSASEPEHRFGASTEAVDDIVGILVAAQIEEYRRGQIERFQPYLLDSSSSRAAMLVTLAIESGLARLDDERLLPARSVIDWLSLNRERQLAQLADYWRRSRWNELAFTPGLAFEGGNLPNEPLLAREALLAALPRDEGWYRVLELVEHVRQIQPDFQRPDGNYDTWYVKDVNSGAFITGFTNWNLVEGRLLAYILLGPLRWLGMVEAGRDSRLSPEGYSHYRLSPRGLAWLNDASLDQKEVNVPIVVRGDGTLLVPFNAERLQRFQIARFADPSAAVAGKPFTYRITPGSLFRAKSQGIDAARIEKFLADASSRKVPRSTSRAIHRWFEKSTEVLLERKVILRANDSEVLQKLADHARTRSLIGEFLGDLAVSVDPEKWTELLDAAAELGLLIDSGKLVEG